MRTRSYIVVWAILVGLTILSLTLSNVLAHRAPLDLGVALAIAFVKSTLVALFFMHLIEGSLVEGLGIIVAVTLLAILVFFCVGDVLGRHTFPRAPVPPLPVANRGPV